MIWIAIGMFLLAYIIGGIYTVREYLWYESFRYFTVHEVGTIVLIFAFWPFARALWRASR